MTRKIIHDLIIKQIRTRAEDQLSEVIGAYQDMFGISGDVDPFTALEYEAELDRVSDLIASMIVSNLPIDD